MHRLNIALESEHEKVCRLWQTLFQGWVLPTAVQSDLSLHLQFQAALPPLPIEPPYFRDTHDLPGEVGILSVYQQEAGYKLLHYLDGALVSVPPADAPPVARGVVVEKAMQYGRFEDITFTSLAPLLRQRGYYLVHAFAASKDGQTLLIIGPSGSGKTTTGLSLLLHGWELLANDILLLEERNGRIYALPTPGIVNIRPRTLELLPALQPRLASIPPVFGQYNITGEALVNGRWSAPSPITHLYFPYIEQRPQTTLHRRNRAVALASLMSESMDRWDEETMSDHLTILQKLVRQADAFELHLGQELEQIPALLQYA
ncbi:MAG: hypothetical protein H6662_00095 [Ardenticatenaceae bacterium]|nr:hypothetical protein [Anaerolineales bacterium]MCB8919955.1 hypothetical protein [Ardenticatenaceae bacterium]MCB8989802.1 hypothetical protein [Ardenticatenaceae bacterium]